MNVFPGITQAASQRYAAQGSARKACVIGFISEATSLRASQARAKGKATVAGRLPHLQ
jgi:hypothetical protein